MVWQIVLVFFHALVLNSVLTTCVLQMTTCATNAVIITRVPLAQHAMAVFVFRMLFAPLGKTPFVMLFYMGLASQTIEGSVALPPLDASKMPFNKHQPQFAVQLVVHVSKLAPIRMKSRAILYHKCIASLEPQLQL